MDAKINQKRWRLARRVILVFACIATVWAVFCVEEDWRGKRVWEACQRELQAKGVVTDWKALVAAALPDDQNFYKAPYMEEWFFKPAKKFTGSLAGLSTNSNTTAAITNETSAADYLKWSDRFQPGFDKIREALKRPYAQLDSDYSQPRDVPHPDYNQIIRLVKVLRQRANCHLLLRQSDQALNDLTMIHNIRRLLECPPTGKPIGLASASVNVAVAGLYLDTVSHGLQSHDWHEPQLAALQEQLRTINLPPFILEALKEEAPYSSRALETISPLELQRLFSQVPSRSRWQMLHNSIFLSLYVVPRGWVYQNMAFASTMTARVLDSFDLTNDLILPKCAEHSVVENLAAAETPLLLWTIWDRMLFHDFTKTIQQAAFTQTKVNEGQIVCALERFRLAHGNYPETLAALIPQFMKKLPHDLIGGYPLHYQRTDDGGFTLYSVGWNEKDDGGQDALNKDGTIDLEKGDWVWRYPVP